MRTPGEDILIWEVATGVIVRRFPNPKGGSLQVRFSPDGRQLAASCFDVIQTWDARTGKLLSTLEGHTDAVPGLTYSPNGRWLASTGFDGTLRIWDASNEQDPHVLFAAKFGCACVAFSPDGTRIASGADDQVIKIWDPETDQPLITLRGHTDMVRSVAFSPTGRLIASSDRSGHVKLWDGTPWVEPAARTAATLRAEEPRRSLGADHDPTPSGTIAKEKNP
jgi:uncharacterized protein with WD repeat